VANPGDMQRFTHLMYALEGLQVPVHRKVLILEGVCHNTFLEDMAAVALMALSIRLAREDQR